LPVIVPAPPPEPVFASPSSLDTCLDEANGALYRNSSWWLGVEIAPLVSELTRAEFGEWPNDSGLGVGIIFGHEGPNNFGTRGRIWVYVKTADMVVDDVLLGAGTFSLDLYKRLFWEDTEIVLGAGPSSGVLDFELGNDTSSEFSGGGITGFLEAWHLLHRFGKLDVGGVGRGRLTLLRGNWTDTTGFVVPATSGDTMNVVEIAFGLEIRRRFGACEDKYWYATLLVDRQNWTSMWMSEFTGTSVGLGGLSINLGLAL
jgi:hypothetical protein